ncbi:sulfotransferase domain-containing protein [Rubrobacter indicoceani]|uniref:sulfotransferase domain-containing protein n=1 Tax=Rubrobacter indicoceani TaxID=2051957 RepID=UPI000E5B25BA|nr:sulfotransferase domain-containing protein [Rubrobacter indicoceani]
MPGKPGGVRSLASKTGRRVASGAISKLRDFPGFERRVSDLFWSSDDGRRVRRQIAEQDREIAFLKERLTSLSGEAEVSYGSPVFFVQGNQKSGTTWLMKMLDAHPEVLCRGEGRPFGRNFSKAGRSGYPAASLYNTLSSSEKLETWIKNSVWSKRDDPERHIDSLSGLAIEYFLKDKLLKSGKKFVGDKTVLLGPDVMKEVSRLTPRSKVIHIVRDGRDVAVSTTHHIWNQAEDRGGNTAITPEQVSRREAYERDPQSVIASGGIFVEGWLERYAGRWSALIQNNIRDGREILGDNYTEVRYEDLIATPEREMARLFGFLGADQSPETVRSCVAAASFEKLSEGRKPGEEAASFFRKGIAGDWKNVFTERNKREFKAGAGRLLIDLGYECDEGW